MRKPAFRTRQRGAKKSREYSIKAPTGGWNTRENMAEMAEEFAIATDNMFGTTSDVRVRPGYANHVTGIGQQVETLMAYNAQGGTQTFFGVANDSVYNVTSAGAVGAAVVGSLSNARWQHFNFTNSAGTSYLCAFNGVDAPRYWNGSSWLTITGVSTPAITGLTTTDVVNGFVFKRRVYLILNNSLSLYYLPVDSVGGEAKRTRLDGYFSRGGYLVSGATWTLDGGEGIDDYLVVISSEGQVAVFEGTNPSSASSWALKGVWNVGEPVSNRCLIKYGGDLLINTTQGTIPLSKALQSSQGSEVAINEDEFLSYNINSAMVEAADDYKANFGWDLAFHPQGNMLILNVPVAEGSLQQQYVMNTTKGSWWRFTGLEANCWEVFNEELYYGTNGEVVKFGADVMNDGGDDIVTDLKQAFSYLGARGRLKYVTAVRPNFSATGEPAVSMTFSVDFGDESPSTGLSFSPTQFAVWDTDAWDVGVWGGALSAFNDWQTLGVVGTALALRMKTVTSGIDVRYASSDTVYEYGGVIG
ncbi:hypothetical protein OAA60_00700 [Porticoccaceae bacterium]|nr:hypothetical protein [Porticoccaceae bacterium]